MIVIQPDGSYAEVPYVDYTSITAAVNPPGRDDAFTAVPLPEGVACGYSMWANDNGLLVGLPENRSAEYLAQYAPLVGPVCLTTFEEAKEDELIPEIKAEARESFKKRLDAFIAMMVAINKAKAEKLAESGALN